jgi:hypothetical protein
VTPTHRRREAVMGLLSGMEPARLGGRDDDRPG